MTLTYTAVRVVYSDTSTIGYGGYIVEHGNLVANGQWSVEDSKQNSIWQELKAMRLMLKSFQSKLENVLFSILILLKCVIVVL